MAALGIGSAMLLPKDYGEALLDGQLELGSRRTHDRRVERLLQGGVTADQIKRIHAPIGLDIGGSSAGEIAVSVIAQLIRARNKRL